MTRQAKRAEERKLGKAIEKFQKGTGPDPRLPPPKPKPKRKMAPTTLAGIMALGAMASVPRGRR